MSLESYQSKRQFKTTPEPKGKIAPSKKKKLAFVVQKHQARSLHYDFRLQVGGVLKSWAVPKGPSMNPHDKHLAIQVEDHPIEYKDFEGEIPEGSYGAGKVSIWDRGYYELYKKSQDPEETLLAKLSQGLVKIILHGKKLKGEFVLVKSPHIGKNSWLLIKIEDEFTQKDKKVKSQDGDPKINLADAPKEKMLKNIQPMLAKTNDKAFDSKDWLFEIKWDGYRAISSWDGKNSQLYSRNGTDFSCKYPKIFEALHTFKHKVVIDGEIVATDQDGLAHFEWLQNYQNEPKGELKYYIFDILWCDGHNLTDWPLLKRKDFLKNIIPKSSILRFNDHLKEQGKKFFKVARTKHLEGIMAKKINSSYQPGKRSGDWLKIKTHLRQEVVIAGFTEPKGSRKFIGALIVGVYEKGLFTFVGHVGGGIPTDQLKPLRAKLESLERKTSPLNTKIEPNYEVHWVSPKLVCEVKFSEWTREGIMRQPIFVGMRDDKKPTEVKRELWKNLE